MLFVCLFFHEAQRFPRSRQIWLQIGEKLPKIIMKVSTNAVAQLVVKLKLIK